MLLKVGTFCKDSDVQVLLGGSVVVALDSFESIFGMRRFFVWKIYEMKFLCYFYKIVQMR